MKKMVSCFLMVMLLLSCYFRDSNITPRKDDEANDIKSYSVFLFLGKVYIFKKFSTEFVNKNHYYKSIEVLSKRDRKIVIKFFENKWVDRKGIYKVEEYFQNEKYVGMTAHYTKRYSKRSKYNKVEMKELESDKNIMIFFMTKDFQRNEGVIRTEQIFSNGKLVRTDYIKKH